MSLYDLGPGQEVELVYAADEPVHVAFAFPYGTDSWKAVEACPKYRLTSEFRPLCGELVEVVDGEAKGAKIASQRGAGLSVSPDQGEVRLKLRNLAGRAMTFQVSASFAIPEDPTKSLSDYLTD